MESDETFRYRRQISFDPIGLHGQAKLRKAAVFVCGCGALGCAVAEMLCRAGIGRIRLVDDDYVQLDNLHRQILFTENDAIKKKSKVDAAADKLSLINRDAKVEPICERLTPQNADRLFDRFDLLIDATDNFRVRFMLNSLAVKKDIPFVSAGVLGASGQVFAVLPGITPCLACMLPSPNGSEEPKSRLDNSGIDESGILSPAVLFAASIQVAESMKILAGNYDVVRSSILSFDLWTNRITMIAFPRDENCMICAH